MLALVRQIFGFLIDLFRSRTALEAEILVLRQQIIVLRRGKPTRLPFVVMDRLVLSWACRCWQSCGRHRCDGPVRGAHRLVPVVIWAFDHGAWPETDPAPWRNGASDRGVDRQSTHGSVRLGARTRLSDPGPGCLLRRRAHPPPPLSRHSRSPDITTLTLAEWLCGAFDQLDPPGECLDHVVVFGERHLR